MRGQFLKKNKFCKENLTKVWKQLPVAILQQAKTGAQSDATLIISYLLKVFERKEIVFISIFEFK